MLRPEVVDRLAIVNAPHPVGYARRAAHARRSFAASWYVFFFQLPFLPGGRAGGRRLRVRPVPISRGRRSRREDVDACVAALRPQGRQAAAAIAYYRAQVRGSLFGGAPSPVVIPRPGARPVGRKGPLPRAVARRSAGQVGAERRGRPARPKPRTGRPSTRPTTSSVTSSGSSRSERPRGRSGRPRRPRFTASTRRWSPSGPPTGATSFPPSGRRVEPLRGDRSRPRTSTTTFFAPSQRAALWTASPSTTVTLASPRQVAPRPRGERGVDLEGDDPPRSGPTMNAARAAP